MKLMTKTLTIAALLCPLLLSGCNLVIQPKLIEANELKNASLLDPNTHNILIEDEPNSPEVSISFTEPPNIQQDDITQINYKPFTRKASVQGTINGHKYPILFDTGNSVLTNITTLHINENQLPALPLKYLNRTNQEVECGVAMIEEMHIGNLTIKNLPAAYGAHCTGYQLFGLDFVNVGQEKEIVLPLSVMRGLKYIKFNNINKIMELSANHSFSINNSAGWKTYPIHTKDTRIYIETTLEGLPVLLMIDTGAEGDLLLTKDCFGALVENKPALRKSWKLNKTGFAPFAGGEFQYKSRLVWELTYDECLHHNSSTIINVVQGDRIYKMLRELQFDGIIGFEFFNRTAMVLDFENNLMWVKKAEGSRFEE